MTHSPKRYRVVILARGKRPLYAIARRQRPDQGAAPLPYPFPYDVVDKWIPDDGLFEAKDARALAAWLRKRRWWGRVKVEEVPAPPEPVASRQLPWWGDAA